MPDSFRANVFSEAGEAIGNVKRRLFPKRRRRNEADAALARWLRVVPAPVIPPQRQAQRSPEGVVIEGTCRVIHPHEEATDE